MDSLKDRCAEERSNQLLLPAHGFTKSERKVHEMKVYHPKMYSKLRGRLVRFPKISARSELVVKVGLYPNMARSTGDNGHNIFLPEKPSSSARRGAHNLGQSYK